MPITGTRCVEIGRAAWPNEPDALCIAKAAMCDGAEKLRQLAKQSRVLSRSATDRHRSNLLRGLARLYEDQAVQLECTTAAQLSLEDQRKLTVGAARFHKRG